VDKESVYIRQIIDGDLTSFSWFVETYKDMAFSIACRILGNDQDAEEVVQDAFLQAFRSIRSFKGRSKFSTWFYRIVVNGSLNCLKKKKLETSYEDMELAQECAEDVEFCYQQLTVRDQTKFINQALKRLRVEDRLILTLYYLEDRAGWSWRCRYAEGPR
jgi:RNA polymerase sigma factor (sigma-70 family)